MPEITIYGAYGLEFHLNLKPPDGEISDDVFSADAQWLLQFLRGGIPAGTFQELRRLIYREYPPYDRPSPSDDRK